jgi:hypothetical protein
VLKALSESVGQIDFVGRIGGPHKNKKKHEYQEPVDQLLLYSCLFLFLCAVGAKSMGSAEWPVPRFLAS